ncbi:MAG TPA: hypothetical protein VHM90_14010 [Phycisphaerae bacterium]|nr:hypothetical protein [Phycisphaerae bacterium]
MVAGLSTDQREVLVTTTLDAAPDHRYALPGDSAIPLIFSLCAGASIIGGIFTPWAVVWGAGSSLVILTLWFYNPTERYRRKSQHRKHHE